MARVECVTAQGFVASISMPLLTELVSINDGFCYRHGAPNGAVPTRQHFIPSKTANLSRTAAGGDVPEMRLQHHQPLTRTAVPLPAALFFG
jgi:hypothetical protein